MGSYKPALDWDGRPSPHDAEDAAWCCSLDGWRRQNRCHTESGVGTSAVVGFPRRRQRAGHEATLPGRIKERASRRALYFQFSAIALTPHFRVAAAKNAAKRDAARSRPVALDASQPHLDDETSSSRPAAR